MYDFWEKIGAHDSVLDIIKHGYRIPFYSMPCRNFQKNNNSSLMQRDFIDTGIKDLLNNAILLLML